MNTFIGFCYGPLLYLYARKVDDEAFMPATHWYVFLPFIGAAIAYFTIAGVIMVSGTSGYGMLKWYNWGSYCGILLSDIVYSLLALRITQRFARQKVVERRIVASIAWCFFGMVCISGPVYFAHMFFNTDLMIPIRVITYTALSALCVMIIYFKFVAGISQEASAIASETATSLRVGATESPLSRKSVLSAEKQEEIWESLEAQMRDNLFFTDCDLNLDKLAGLTGINKYHLSETLNGFAGKSFYQYINEYRIAYALKEMELVSANHSEEFNFLSLAYKSGFKAKSSFNRYFKEITGFTPSEHLRILRHPKIAL